MSEWVLVVGAGLACLVIRLAPEAWLRGRPPPRLLAETLPWVPIAVAGTLVAVLHVGAPADKRAEYLVAAVPASLTLLWRGTFYVPLFVGALTLALWRLAG